MRDRLVISGLLLTLVVVRGQAAQDQEPAFDVASVKPSDGDKSWGGFRPFPGRFVAHDVPVESLIGFAYGAVTDVFEAPGWARSERYDVNAKVSGTQTRARQQAMMRTLLRERFNFVGHVETQQRHVLALVRAKPDDPLPPGLQRVDADCERPSTAGNVAALAPSSLTGDIPACRSIDNGAILHSGGMTMAQFAGALRGTVGQQVFDETSLPGYYAFLFRRARRGITAPLPGEEDYPDVATALREQLGLKLVQHKADVKVLVVDRLERPTPD